MTVKALRWTITWVCEHGRHVVEQRVPVGKGIRIACPADALTEEDDPRPLRKGEGPSSLIVELRGPIQFATAEPAPAGTGK